MTTPVSAWGCRLTVSTSPRSTRRIGLDAEFVVVTWFGNEGQVGWGSKVVTFNYYGNVQNAFETAPHYKLAMDVPTCRTVPIQRKTNSDGYTVRLFSALIIGRGKIADFYFNKIKGTDYDEGEIVGNIEFEGGNGAYVMKKNDYKAFPTAYEANPSALYETNFVSRGYRKAGYLLRTNYISKDEYMVVRTRVKTDGNGNVISAHYAKIFGPFSAGDNFIVADEIVFNPNVNDPNLEFDVRKNLNPDCTETGLYP